MILKSLSLSSPSFFLFPHFYLLFLDEGGVIVVCEQTITYFNGPGTARSIATPATAIVAHGKIDADGSRFLLGDYQGLLYILFLKHQNGRVTEIKLERVGEV